MPDSEAARSIEKQIFLEADALEDPEAREAFLREKCGDDEEMLERLRDLLELAGDEDKLVLPGVFADRKARRVELSGVFNDLDDHASVEFLVIGEKSDNDYEALVRAYVTPSDVRKALVFTNTFNLSRSVVVTKPASSRRWQSARQEVV